MMRCGGCRPRSCCPAGTAAVAFALGIIASLLLSTGAAILVALCAFCAAAALLK
jgi:hypothetical protein